MSDNLFEMLFNAKGPDFAPEPVDVPHKRTSQPLKTFRPLTDDELRAVVDRNNHRCPFHNCVGQDTVIEMLLALLVQALRDANHALPGGNALLFTGAASTGKTSMAKLLCDEQGLDLPFVQAEAKAIKNTGDIFKLLSTAADEANLTLVPLGTDSGRTRYMFPPMCMFIDEMHGLGPATMDALLRGTEPKDATLVTDDVIVDCQHILWIGATTERGSIVRRKPAFDTRFQTIEFVCYTKKEVSQIIQLNAPSDWTKDDCDAVAARSGGVIRIALKIIQRVEQQLGLLRLSNPTAGRQDAINKVGEQMQIDEHGMSKMQLRVLEALAHKYPDGMTYGQLSKIINRDTEELKEVVLPGLLLHSADHPAKVSWTGRTYISAAGAEDLKNRKLIDNELYRSIVVV